MLQGFEKIQSMAAARGFARAYALPLMNLSAWLEAAEAAGIAPLRCDLPALYPWARSVLLLVWAYTPYPPPSRIPAYYVASHAGYRACAALRGEIAALGCRCERAELPARTLALQAGVGVQGRNGLLRLVELGSRIVLFTLLTDACDPAPVLDAAPGCPPDCTACADACPAGAIAAGVTQRKCMRYYMDDTPYPDWVYQVQQKHLGCEICMEVCPLNEPCGFCEPPPEVAEAFSAARLAAEEEAAARALVGKNITRRHKLAAEARNFLSRDKRNKNQ